MVFPIDLPIFRPLASSNIPCAKIKRGKLVRLTSSTEKPELAKVDKDAMDNFDAWSFGQDVCCKA